jgi:hypothetical protein
MKDVLARKLQHSHGALELRHAHNATLTNDFRAASGWEASDALLTQRRLRRILIQLSQEVVVFGRDITEKQIGYL